MSDKTADPFMRVIAVGPPRYAPTRPVVGELLIEIYDGYPCGFGVTVAGKPVAWLSLQTVTEALEGYLRAMEICT